MFVFCYLFKDPEIVAAFADISANPSVMTQYAEQPSIQNLIASMYAKFGGPSVVSNQLAEESNVLNGNN